MTDESSVDRHRRGVVELSRAGAALATDAPTVTVNNPEWFTWMRGEYTPTPQRQELHNALKRAYVEKYPDVRNESRAMVLAGPPGAGKSTVKKDQLKERESHYLSVDADDFKTMLLEEALRDGSYESFIKPDAVKSLESTGEKFYPLELASLVHEESSYLAKQVRDDALRQGKNVIIDTVLSSDKTARELARTFESRGYAVEVLDVEVPFEISAGRIARRWQSSYEKALGKGGLGGRWVPSQYARGVFDGPNGKTKSEAAAKVLAEECPVVQRYRVFRTTQEGTPERPAVAECEVDLRRTAPGADLQGERSPIAPAGSKVREASSPKSPSAGTSAVDSPRDPTRNLSAYRASFPRPATEATKPSNSAGPANRARPRAGQRPDLGRD